MDALSSLAMYTDSEEDEDHEMQDLHQPSTTNSNSHPNSNANVSNLLSLNLYNSPSPKSNNRPTPKSIQPSQQSSPPLQLDSDNDYHNAINTNNHPIFDTAPPQIPPSPDIKPDTSQQQIIKDLFKTHKTHKNYYKHTFLGDDFQDNPEWFDYLLSKLQLFQYDPSQNKGYLETEMEWKLDEYASNLSQTIHEIGQWRDKDDNVDTLMRLLENKIRENEQRIREKRQKKERERQQMMKERIERRVPTPTIGVNYGYQKRYKSVNTHNMNVMNAAKNAVLAKKNQFITNKNKQLMNDKKKCKSRWDDKK